MLAQSPEVDQIPKAREQHDPNIGHVRNDGKGASETRCCEKLDIRVMADCRSHAGGVWICRADHNNLARSQIPLECGYLRPP